MSEHYWKVKAEVVLPQCDELLIESHARRNAIVHNNSRVDQKYKQYTGSKREIGDFLKTEENYAIRISNLYLLILKELFLAVKETWEKEDVFKS